MVGGQPPCSPSAALVSRSVAVSKQKKMVKEELKRPDHFVDFWTHAWTRAAAVLKPRQKPVVAGLVAVVVVVAGAIVFENLDEERKVESSEAFMRVEKMAPADLEPAPSDGTVDTVKGPKDEKDQKDDVPRFKTAAERQAAVLKELDALLAKNGGGSVKDEALVLKGSELLEVGRFDDAIAAFDAALAAKLDKRLRFLAHEGRGYAFEGKGDLDKAAAAFADLEQDAAAWNGFYKDRATYQKARLSERKGDKAGAVTLYKELLQKAPDSPLHDEITDRLAVLEAR